MKNSTNTIRSTVLAPAKINLMLAVGKKRSDGYHEIASIMQTLDLADRIDIDIEMWNSTDIDVLVEAHKIPNGDTLVTSAVKSLFKRAGVGARVWITIDKEIPIGAGLGGGSSDAAAVLKEIWNLIELPIVYDDLVEIASSVGSDVPFFLLGPESSAFVTGRGECVEQIEPITPRAWLLAFPNVHQSTASVYALHDPELVEPLPKTSKQARLITQNTVHRNDLAIPARKICADLDRLFNAIIDAGGVPLVCGSGATLAIPINSKDERLAFEAVAKSAVPGCWLRATWTTSKTSKEKTLKEYR